MYNKELTIKQSHASRVRGLKLTILAACLLGYTSHASRVRGLKHYPEGVYITTLYNTRINADKISIIKRLQKDIRKNTKQLSISVTALQELENAMPDEVAKDGEVIELRKQYRKQTEVLINQKLNNLPKNHLPLMVDEKTTKQAEYNLTTSEEE